MPPPSLPRLAALRPVIKSEWERLLRGEPPDSPLGHPDMLVHLMDHTLDRLEEGLGQGTMRWLSRSVAASSPLRHRCRCTLNPLLKYYATGELALHAAALGAGEAIDPILDLFHALAQEEVQLLCATCQHQGQPGCDLPPSAFNPPPAAASRATPSATRRSRGGKRG